MYGGNRREESGRCRRCGHCQLRCGVLLTALKLPNREAVGTEQDALRGKLDPQWGAGDFKHKLSPYRPFEIRTIADRDDEGPRSPDDTAFVVPSQRLLLERICGVDCAALR